MSSNTSVLLLFELKRSGAEVYGNEKKNKLSALREGLGEGLRTTLLFLNWSAPLYFKTVYFPALATSLKHYLTFSFTDSSLWISIFRWIQCDLYQLLQIGSEGTFMCLFCLFSLQTERQGWRGWGERALQIKQTIGEQNPKSQQRHIFWCETRVPHPSTATISLTSITDADQTHTWGATFIHKCAGCTVWEWLVWDTPLRSQLTANKLWGSST